ncbi:hypothetical protein KR059_003028 [Drosophila kikkawai]|nr:hypothetical protein KR059_003028 [Drosophila kikkawai]
MLSIEDAPKAEAAAAEVAHTLVIFGASGNLARRKVFPLLWTLYRDNQLPKRFRIFTYCRTPVRVSTYRRRVMPYVTLDQIKDLEKYERFWSKVYCVQGKYNKPEHYAALAKAMRKQERKHTHLVSPKANRIFYLALPPRSFDQVTLHASRQCSSPNGWTRIIVEKPFASDDITYGFFRKALLESFRESQIYLIDHQLSRRVIQNLLLLRFANNFWGNTMNNRHVAAVMISVKSALPVPEWRANYFEEFGIIRDLMGNHMMNMLAMMAMDQPFASSTEEVREERLKTLRQVVAPDIRHVVIGQYIRKSEGSKCGYKEHSYIANDSTQATFALVILHIDSPRWQGVPFILRAGMALNDTKTEVRIQYKPVDCQPYHTHSGEIRNEMVLRSQPTEEIFMRLRLKKPGQELCPGDAELNLCLDDCGRELPRMKHYQDALLDVFKGDQTYFLDTEEQCQIWRIFSPILSLIDTLRPYPLYYEFGSRGPIQAYRQAERAGFVFFASDEWHRGEEELMESTLEKKVSKASLGPKDVKPERARKPWRCLGKDKQEQGFKK